MIIYSKDNAQRAVVKSFEYNGEFMGERYITCDVLCDSVIPFAIGDYVEYRGERYELNVLPQVTRNSRSKTVGDSLKYSSVKFNSLADELARCMFLDTVTDDNQLHYFALPEFAFYAPTVKSLVERIKANLDRVYKVNKWTVICNDADIADGETDVSISINNQNCWEALSLVNSQFNLEFRIIGRTITIGSTGKLVQSDWDKIYYAEPNTTTKVHRKLEYGKDKGLLNIEKNVDSSQNVITRLRIYGNTTNMPTRYYQKLGTNIPNNLSVNRLMLPDYSKDTLSKYVGTSDNRHTYSSDKYDPYIDSLNTSTLGVREFTVYADGSNEDIEDIHPTIEGMTAEELKAAKLSTASTGALDVVVSAEQIKDDGVFEDDKFTPAGNSFSKDYTIYHEEGRLAKVSFKITPTTDGVYSFCLGELFSVNVTSGADKFRSAWNCTFNNGSNSLSYSYDEKATVGSDGVFKYENIKFDFELEGGVEYDVVLSFLLSIDGCSVSFKESVDTISGSYKIKASGSTFKLKIKDIGFDINDYVSTDGDPTLCFKSGSCAGREFKILSCKYENSGYTLKLERVEDSSLNIYFPNTSYQVSANDKFVLTNIYMPDVYIQAASQRLLEAGKAYLDANDSTAYTYTPKIDNIFIQRERDWADANSKTSIYYGLYEGMRLPFKDEELLIDGEVLIDKLTIKEGDSLIPQISVSLRDEKQVGTIQKLMNTVNDIKNGIIVTNGGKTGASNVVLLTTTSTEISSDGSAYSSARADKEFLSKKHSDKTSGTLTMANAVVEGSTKFTDAAFNEGQSGGSVYKDNNGSVVAEFDKVFVHQQLKASEAEIQSLSYVGGVLVLTPATGFKVVHVIENKDDSEAVTSYDLLWLNKDENNTAIRNQWKQNDQALCQVFDNPSYNGEVGDIGINKSGLNTKFYWRLVDIVYSNYTYNGASYNAIRVSNTTVSGTSVPAVGDSVVMLGHRGNDESRQSAIIEAAAGGYSPYIRIFKGIKSFEMPESVDTQLKGGNNIFTGTVNITGGNIGDKSFNDFTSGVQQAIESAQSALETVSTLKVGMTNLLRNSGFTGDFLSEQFTNGEVVTEKSEMFSPSLQRWEYTSDVSVIKNNSTDAANDKWDFSESGMLCVMKGGSIKQNLYWNITNEANYSFSVYAKRRSGVTTNQQISMKLTNGTDTKTIETWTLPTSWGANRDSNRLYVTFSPSTLGVVGYTHLILEGDAIVTELQLEKGSVTGWSLCPLDNTSEMSYYSQLKYMALAMAQDTKVEGGLILSTLLKLGYTDTNGDWHCKAGVSGMDEEGDTSPAFWAGGDMQKAINASAFFSSDTFVKPTAQEKANMAKAVITHGGRAILNDAVIQGTIYADNGEFNGKVVATEGEFNGVIKANAIYMNGKTIPSSQSVVLNPSSDESTMFNGCFGCVFTLPSPDSCVGLTYTFVGLKNRSSAGSSNITIKSSSDFAIYLGDGSYTWGDSDPSNGRAKKIEFLNGVIQLISDGNDWILTTITDKTGFNPYKQL